MKGVTAARLLPARPRSYFNPHTREGCDFQELDVVLILQAISIHTPVKGVTARDERGEERHLISIHTPVKGVTSPSS